MHNLALSGSLEKEAWTWISMENEILLLKGGPLQDRVEAHYWGTVVKFGTPCSSTVLYPKPKQCAFVSNVLFSFHILNKKIRENINKWCLKSKQIILDEHEEKTHGSASVLSYKKLKHNFSDNKNICKVFPCQGFLGVMSFVEEHMSGLPSPGYITVVYNFLCHWFHLK